MHTASVVTTPTLKIQGEHMPQWAYRSLTEVTAEEMATALLNIFPDYPVAAPPKFDGSLFERRFHGENLDRVASCLVLCGTATAAVMLVARRGASFHISGLGTAPQFRRLGIGAELISRTVAEATSVGVKRIRVEVAVTNTVALQMYQAAGFRIRRQLVGYRRLGSVCATGGDPREIDTYDVVQTIASGGTTDLPWRFQPASLAGCSRLSRGYELSREGYAIVLPRGDELDLQALFVHPECRRRGVARRMIDALMSLHSCQLCTVHPFVPNDLAVEFFAATQFQVSGDAQYELERVI